MVTLAGAKAAQPYIGTLNTLNTAVAALAAAIAANNTIGQITIQVYSADGKTSSTISIPFALNAADSATILNDIKNVIANDVNIQTNALGAIT
jgi:hypothetical protein